MLEFKNVSKSFPGPRGSVRVIRDASFRVAAGSLAVVHGPSGCGKSTLLFTAGAMLKPESGRVCFQDESIYGMPHYRRNAFRGSSVGFIFQQFHLLTYLNAEENITWPLRWNKGDSARLRGRLPELAKRLGIQHRLAHLPRQLSAGEQQRVAVARALIGEKKLVCADEPTGNLDEENAALVIDVLREEASRGTIVLIATHQAGFAPQARLQIEMGTGGLSVAARDKSETRKSLVP